MLSALWACPAQPPLSPLPYPSLPFFLYAKPADAARACNSWWWYSRTTRRTTTTTGQTLNNPSHNIHQNDAVLNQCKNKFWKRLRGVCQGSRGREREKNLCISYAIVHWTTIGTLRLDDFVYLSLSRTLLHADKCISKSKHCSCWLNLKDIMNLSRQAAQAAGELLSQRELSVSEEGLTMGKICWIT